MCHAAARISGVTSASTSKSPNVSHLSASLTEKPCEAQGRGGCYKKEAVELWEPALAWLSSASIAFHVGE